MPDKIYEKIKDHPVIFIIMLIGALASIIGLFLFINGNNKTKPINEMQNREYVSVIRQTLPGRFTHKLRETLTFHTAFYLQMLCVVYRSYKTVPSFPISYSNQHHLYR